jgi:hypothetical protein
MEYLIGVVLALGISIGATAVGLTIHRFSAISFHSFCRCGRLLPPYFTRANEAEFHYARAAPAGSTVPTARIGMGRLADFAQDGSRESALGSHLCRNELKSLKVVLFRSRLALGITSAS